MNLALCVLLCNFLVLSTFTVVTGENVNMKKNVFQGNGGYEDDEDLADGSGNGDPLESSGSGFGPPDEEITDRTHSELPGVKKSSATTSPKIEKEEPTLPMPQPPKPQSPPPPPPVQPETIAPDTSSKATNVQQETRQLPAPPPEEKHPIDTSFNTPIDKTPIDDTNRNDNVYIINPTHDRDRTTSFFAQPGILAAVIGGAVVGLLCAILVVMFIVYRMRKKDEGSYALEEMKRCPATNPYMKPNHREFFA